jgi:peptide/nickel transport system permease protein
MPEQSPDTVGPDQLPDRGEELIQTLVGDERAHDVPTDAATQHFAAVQAGSVKVKRNGLTVGAWLAIGWMVLLFLAAILAPVLPIADPINDADPAKATQGPSLEHLFGLDGNGRDVFSRVIWGARNSLFIAIVAVLAGFLIGGVLGLVAGYFKGRIGGALGALTDILLAFPQLVLALAVVSFLGRTVFNVTLALGIVSIPILSRITRASTLSWSEREFVTAARAQGAGHVRTMWREVLPNVLPAMLSIALLGVAVAIVAEASLSIVGAGVKPDVTTWGNVIFSGQSFLREAPTMVLLPSLVIFLTVFSLNYLGDVVRARFDVREAAL